MSEVKSKGPVTADDTETSKPTPKKRLLDFIANKTGMTKVQVSAFLDALQEAAIDELKTTGTVVLPNIAKITMITKKATKERNSINPATHQPMVVAAKPERKALKSVTLKVLQDSVMI